MTRHTFIEKNTPQNQAFVAIAIEYMENVFKRTRSYMVVLEDYVVDSEKYGISAEFITRRVVFYREVLVDGFHYLKNETMGYEYFSSSLKKLYEQDVAALLARLDALEPTN